ncbi:MAG: PAS domain S-box protein [Methanomicrobiaceae archaeon]|nr:PAS domain S-box protein [Methanomicrobiaceae archaeon]
MKENENEVYFRISGKYTDTEIIKIFVIACFVLLSLMVSILAFNIPISDWNYPGIFIVPQIYYIPILLISLWYPKKGLQASILLISGFLGVTSYYYYIGLPVDPFIAGLNVAIFIWVIITTTYMAEASGLVNFKYKAFFRNAGAGMLILDIDNSKILDVNKKACEILEMKEEEIVGRNIEECFDRKISEEEIFNEIENKKIYLIPENLKKTILFSAGYNKSLGHIECIILDITEQEKEINYAEETKQKMLEFLRSSNDLLFILDLNANIKSFDWQMAKKYEVNTADYIGKPIMDLVPEDSKNDCLRYFNEVICTGNTITFETKIRIKQDKKRILIILGAITASGKIKEVLVAFHEIGKDLPNKDELLLEFEKRKWANFINTAAHELRTPLQPLLGYLHLLTDESFNSDLSQETSIIVKKCLESAERECEIVEKILEAGLAESFKINLKIEDFKLKQLIGEILTINKIQKEAEVIFDISETVSISADRDRIYQVFEGIILNAIKYSSQPKILIIRYKEDLSNHIIEITDNGIGIPSDSLDEIFEPFFIKNPSDLTRGTGRIGLGLSIAKKYISLHNGDIKVHSIPGKGSTFTIIIPKID